MIAEADVWAALRTIHDPEIPTISVVDLGIVHDVRIGSERVEVDLLPTFTGCPALDVMRFAVLEGLAPIAGPVDVRFTTAIPWTSDRITPAGHAALTAAGLAPPGTHRPACPYCGSADTSMENPFGPTLCRSIWYCSGCRQPFERFKAV